MTLVTVGEKGDHGEKVDDQTLFKYLYNRQIQTDNSSNAMDQKLALVLGFEGVILGLILLSTGINEYWWIGLTGVLFILASMILTGITYCAVDFDKALANFSKNYSPDQLEIKKGRPLPSPKRFSDMKIPGSGGDKDPKDLFSYSDFNNVFLYSIINNLKTIDMKASRFKYILLLFFIGLIVVIIGHFLPIVLPVSIKLVPVITK